MCNGPLTALPACTSPATVTTAVTDSAALPAASEALKMTVVSPIGKVVSALLVMMTVSSTLSIALAAARNTAISASVAATPEPLEAVTAISAGAVRIGAA